jgi:hypothetical protein
VSVTATSASLKLNACYRTLSGEEVKIVAFDGSCVIYVVGHRGIYPTWNRNMWRSTPKPDFAKEVAFEMVSR